MNILIVNCSPVKNGATAGRGGFSIQSANLTVCGICLFVVIVPFALRYDNIIIIDHINKPVFFVNPSAPFSIQAVF